MNIPPLTIAVNSATQIIETAGKQNRALTDKETTQIENSIRKANAIFGIANLTKLLSEAAAAQQGTALDTRLSRIENMLVEQQKSKPKGKGK